MSPEEYFQHLNQRVQEHQDGSDAYSDKRSVDFCKKLLQSISISSLSDAFLYCAAFNYLNAAVKQDKSVGYAFKSRIQDVVSACMNNRIPGIRFFLSQDEKGSVLYCLLAEQFVFSFHSVSFSDERLRDLFASSKPIYFDGIRKQQCPNLILRSAIERCNDRNANASPVQSPTRPLAPNPSASPYQQPYQSQGASSSGGPIHEVSARVNVYPIQDIIKDFQLNRLVTNRRVAENIAVVISSVYFYKDLIDSPNSVPTHIRKEMFREIITQTYSVVEAVEVEVGRRLAKQKRIKLPSDSGKDPRFDQSICIDLCHKEYGFDPKTNNMYKEYRDLRHNVHLCKDQQIINDTYYTEEVTTKWFSFMEQYLSYLAK